MPDEIWKTIKRKFPNLPDYEINRLVLEEIARKQAEDAKKQAAVAATAAEEPQLAKMLEDMGVLGKKINVRWRDGGLIRPITELDALHQNRILVGVGPAKRNEPYPIDQIKFIFDKNQGLFCYFFSPKLESPNYPYTNKRVRSFAEFYDLFGNITDEDGVIERIMEGLTAPERKTFEMPKYQLALPAPPERKMLRQLNALPAPPERKMLRQLGALPTQPEQKMLRQLKELPAPSPPKEEKKKYKLTVYVNPPEAATTRPPAGETTEWEPNTVVPIKAFPEFGWENKFMGWKFNNGQPIVHSLEARAVVNQEHVTATAVFKGERVPLIIDSRPVQGISGWLLIGNIPKPITTTHRESDVSQYLGHMVMVAMPKRAATGGRAWIFDHWEHAQLVDEGDPIYDALRGLSATGLSTNQSTERSDKVIGIVDLISPGLPPSITVIAVYRETGEVTHEDRGRWKSSYEMGIVPYRGARSAIGDLSSTAGGYTVRGLRRGPFGGKSWFREGMLSKNPALQAAKNKGYRELNVIARDWYRKKVEPRVRQARADAKDIRTARKKFQDTLKLAMNKAGKSGAGKADASAAMTAAAPELGAMGAMMGSAAGKVSAAQQDMVRDIIKEQYEELEKYTDEKIKKTDAELNDLSYQLRQYLRDKATAIGDSLSRIYRFGVNGSEENELKSYLTSAADEIAENFMTRGRTATHAIERGLKYMEFGGKTWSGAYENLREQVLDFLTGPWILGLIVLLAEWVLAAVYLPGPIRGWATAWMIIVGAVAMIIKPGESTLFLEGLVGGAMIGLSSFIFVFGFANMFEMTADIWGWGGLFILILSFFGVFEAYGVRGYGLVKNIAIIMIVFGYLTLGPYAGYTQMYVGEVKAPIMIGLAYLKQGIRDLWMMITDPSEWYAQQQLRNVRPETPLSYAKGVEIAYLRSMPDIVPGGEPFLLAMVYENQGSMPAKDVTSDATCLKNCRSLTAAAVAGGRVRGGVTGMATACAANSDCDNEPVNIMCDTAIGECVQCIEDSHCDPGYVCLWYECVQSSAPTTATTTSISGATTTSTSGGATTTPVAGTDVTTDTGGVQRKTTGDLDLSESDNVEFSFIADRKPREFAKVEAGVEFTYSTASSLKVTIIDRQEMLNQFRHGLKFLPVQAIGKPGVAMVSINVGPQPVQDVDASRLYKSVLISVINNRINIEENDFSKIILNDKTTFRIKIDKGIGTFYTTDPCSNPLLSFIRIYDEGTMQVVEYKIAADKAPIEIEPIATSEIFTFFCKVGLNDIAVSKTGLMTVELMDYHFRISQVKQIMITEPLGVGEELTDGQTPVQPTPVDDSFTVDGWKFYGAGAGVEYISNNWVKFTQYQSDGYFVYFTPNRAITDGLGRNTFFIETAVSGVTLEARELRDLNCADGLASPTNIASFVDRYIIGFLSDECDVPDSYYDPSIGDDFVFYIDHQDNAAQKVWIGLRKDYTSVPVLGDSYFCNWKMKQFGGCARGEYDCDDTSECAQGLECIFAGGVLGGGSDICCNPGEVRQWAGDTLTCAQP